MILICSDRTIDQVVQHHGVNKATLHRWWNQYGGMKAGNVKRLKELEQENNRLKRVVANQALDIQILKDANAIKGKW